MEKGFNCALCHYYNITSSNDIECSAGHRMCKDCSDSYKSFLETNPQQTVPAKCPECKVLYSSEYIESKLDDKQLKEYKRNLKITKLTSEKKMVNCTHCNYYEVWKTTSTIKFFNCKDKSCGVTHCTICLEDIDNSKSYEDTKSQEEYELTTHPNCIKYEDMIKEWEDITINGSLRHCPNPSCKTGGSKNENCLHMKCCACGTEYCYFCGKSEANCDKKNK